MNKTENKVLAFIKANHLVSRGSEVIVAVSGGADSVGLLHILHNISSELDISLHVAHLDHMLRGEPSRQDAEFVKKLADRLCLPATLGLEDVSAYRQQHRLTLEEAAREVRYKFLEEVVKATGATCAAVAHTMNDHVETVLLHLLRGSGLTGLAGLQAKSVLRYKRVGPLTLIRPLLCLNRGDIEEYCRDSNIEFRNDASNESLSFTRNRIRRKLLPSLRQDFNPSIDEALDRLSKLAVEEVDFKNREAAKASESIIRTEGPLVKIDRKGYLGLHPALKRALLRQALVSVLGSPKDIEAVHIEKMVDLAEGETGRSVNLPDGINFISSYSELVLGRDVSADIPLPEITGTYAINVPGVTEMPGWNITASVIEYGPDLITGKENDGFSQLFDFDAVGSELKVRTRKPGDRFIPLGEVAEKSVKDYFIDAKVPRLWRPRVPVVVNHGQIVWLAGYRLDDRAKVTPATKNVLKLVFRPQSTILPV
ncbi:tRNA lysidine(34) synthetase TilS [Dehalogenimonas etheniformans]|uniref:tRNA(Ile)-lysidine synthase n=1 Tax=Dehalogenimonas etheniformans TaxID=1536648 RepID=A0A2P5P6R3_9CHLR|nr:tRNA lysidine(34) synthetase TilS [Dehalogenimonas etheniformans]PPD57980.1 tRNA lysidine(34) synthetase TilS [Dehalogenimonas etheniformans]QNT75331.1 tRNA lysidine(34) synthetase TilS [Dehalogenimonas etheniformans]